MEKKVSKTRYKIPQIKNPNAAGIDVGSRAHYVSIPSGRDKEVIRKFSWVTNDLHQMARWLKECGIDSVAMESTGVYWVQLYDVLESYGLDVYLVDARKIKNVSGRKTDVSDCQWIQELHSYGLLSKAFIPSQEIRILRCYMRQRENLVTQSGSQIQKMQKVLTQMNIQLQNVVSDISGVTSLSIIEAIVSGERDTKRLASLRIGTCKSSVEDFEEALVGNYKEEYVFQLRQELELYKFLLGQIAMCDKALEGASKAFPDKSSGNYKNKKVQKRRKGMGFCGEEEAHRLTGVDVCSIPGIAGITALKIITEVGTDLSAFKSAKNFTSWLCLCPNNKITGDKIFSGRTKSNASRAANAFRMAAHTLSNSKSSLGGFYRRLRLRKGGAKAVTATARKIAEIYYIMLTKGESYVEKGLNYYEQNYRNRAVKNLERKAKEFGFELKCIETKQKQNTELSITYASVS